MKNVFFAAVLMLCSTVLLAQTTQPTTQPIQERIGTKQVEKPTMQKPAKPATPAVKKPTMKMPEKPKVQKPAKPKMPAKPKTPAKPKMPKMQMPKLPGANILKSAGIDNLANSLKGMGIGKKEANAISLKNMDLLKKAGTLVKDGKVDWKSALKEVKGLNKSNLKDVKGMLTKDQLKQYKPVAKKIWVAVKDFLLKALKK